MTIEQANENFWNNVIKDVEKVAPNLLKQECVSCDENKETYELCIDCQKKMIKENAIVTLKLLESRIIEEIEDKWATFDKVNSDLDNRDVEELLSILTEIKNLEERELGVRLSIRDLNYANLPTKRIEMV